MKGSKKLGVFIGKDLTIRHCDSAEQYIREIKNSRTLSKNDEFELFRQYGLTIDNNTKIIIRNKIVENNLKWVISVAKRYTNYNNVTFEDLVNQGNLGMIEAFYKYDYTFGVPFYNFATQYIRMSITSYVDEIETIRQPGTNKLIDRYVNKVKIDLHRIGNHHPTNDDIIEMYNKITHIKLPKLTSAYLSNYNFTKGVQSLDEPLSNQDENDSDNYNGNSNLASESTDIFDYETRDILLAKLKSKLNETELNIILHKFGFADKNGGKTFEQIAENLDYTTSRISQIYTSAINKLKNDTQIKKMLVS